MREIVTKYYVYSYDELSESAKENAYYGWLSAHDSYVWTSDWEEVLNRFCKVFHICLGNWEISTHGGYSYCVLDYGNSSARNCHGIRLCKYLNNNDSYYYKLDDKHVGIDDFCDKCGLTGFCGDYNVLLPIKECKQYKRIFDSCEDLIDACLDNLFKSWLADMEYEESKELFEETVTLENWEFTEDGKIA